MKKLVLLFAIAASASVFAASPAATQQWVRNYVATNTTAGGGVSQQWVIDYVNSMMSNVTESAETATTSSGFQARANNAVSMALVEASVSGLHAQACLYQFTTNAYTSVKMADAPSGNGWTNAVYGCYIATNQAHEAVLSIGEIEYNCSTFSNYTSRNDFKYVLGDITNVVSVSYSSVTTNDWKTARGEN